MNKTDCDFDFEQSFFDGVLIITPFIRYDSRGSFVKDYNENVFMTNGESFPLKETFYTQSYKNTIRALHFQREKQMPKLIRCLKGRIFDVIVDLRADSQTFSKWFGIELSDENNKAVLIPAGFGHGYLALTDAFVSYKCGEVFYPEYDDGILWNDPDIGIEWPIASGETIIISDKDLCLQSFSDFRERYGQLL